MSKTEHFLLDFLDPYQMTSQDILMDERRFTTIDNNIYALFKVFGNGVLVLSSTEFPLYVELFTGADAIKKITVSAGRAFVNYRSINYTSSVVLDLPSQVGTATTQKFYLYLRDNPSTPQTELGDFFFSTEKLEEADSYIGLGAISINYSTGAATYYDDSDNGRQIINIKKLFLSFINSHIHTGGLGNPKKVDLERETTGLISPDAISMVDASLIRGGQISQYTTPQIDHDELDNSGNLSHAQIDAAILSYRDSLNLEIVASVNQLKVVARVIRTTPETSSFSSVSGSFPSGSIATIDRGLKNILVYVPDISTDGLVAGLSGPTGTQKANISTSATGSYFSSTSYDSVAFIDRTNNSVYLGASGINQQKVFVLQNIKPMTKMATYGQTGYFAGFVPGMDVEMNSGSAHMIHAIPGMSGSLGGDIIEKFQVYKLTDTENYNSTKSFGTSGVQFGALLTNLVDFAPTGLCISQNKAHLLFASNATGPRVISSYLNGYFSVIQPVNLFAATGPTGASNSFYYDSATGSRAIMFNSGDALVNLSGIDYVYNTLGSGKIDKINSKLIITENSATSLKITELGPTGAIQSVEVGTGTNIIKSAVKSYVSATSYRVFYINNNRLYVNDSGNTTELGYFENVVDMVVRYGLLFLLTSESGTQYLYYAFESGYPTIFNKIALATASPSTARFDVFQQTSSDPVFIGVVSGNKYQVFNLQGREIYRYQLGTSGSNGPAITAMYSQFDIGDATIDLKYG